MHDLFGCAWLQNSSQSRIVIVKSCGLGYEKFVLWFHCKTDVSNICSRAAFWSVWIHESHGQLRKKQPTN
jgi:hypothetical protein